MKRIASARALILLGVIVLFAACGKDDKPTGPPLPGDAVADFLLPDVNPGSPTYNHNVSPRDYRGKISAWYFGNAT